MIVLEIFLAILLWILYIVLGIISLVVLLLFFPVRARVNFAEKLDVQLKFLFLKFDLLKEKEEKPPKEKPKEDPKEKGEKKPNLVLEKIKIIYKKRGALGFLRLVKRLLWTISQGTYKTIKHLKIRDVDLYYIVSASDASACALAYGNACGIIYPCSSLVKKIFKIKKMAVSVDLDFKGEKPKIMAEINVSYMPVFAVANVVKMAFKSIKLILSKKDNKKG